MQLISILKDPDETMTVETSHHGSRAISTVTLSVMRGHASTMILTLHAPSREAAETLAEAMRAFYGVTESSSEPAQLAAA